jgi:methyl-accepting chemotaxis protein
MKLNIRNKMLLGFAAVLISTVLVGLFAVNQLSTINAGSKTMYSDQLQSVYYAQEATTNLVYMGRSILQAVVFIDDPTKVSEQLSEIEADKADMTKDLDSLTPLLATDQGKALLTDANTKLNNYYDMLSTVSTAVKAGNAADAKTKLDQLLTIAVPADDALNAMIDNKNSQASDLAQSNDALYQSSRLILLGIIFVVVILGIAIAFLISLGISRPLKFLVEAANNMAKGDLNRKMSEQKKEQLRQMKDEIGDISRAFAGIRLYMTAMAEDAQRIADGDLTIDIRPKSETDELGIAFSQMLLKMRQMVGQIAESASALSMASDQLASAASQAGQATSQIAKTVQQVAQGTSQQADATNRTAKAMEQMTRAIDGVAKGAMEQAKAAASTTELTNQLNQVVQQVAGNADSVSKNSAEAEKAAREGTATVEATIQGMHNIQAKVGLSAKKVEEMGQRSDQIGTIVETIDDIASQTNLLALNAAIEAARAGEHGKGFAVVADEVRKLAERSSVATKEINGLIRGIQKTVAEAVQAMNEGSVEVEAGVRQANEAGKSLSNILDAAETVFKQADQAAAASQRMNALVTEMVSAADTVSSIVEENTASTEQMAANANEVTQAIEKDRKSVV